MSKKLKSKTKFQNKKLCEMCNDTFQVYEYIINGISFRWCRKCAMKWKRENSKLVKQANRFIEKIEIPSWKRMLKKLIEWVTK